MTNTRKLLLLFSEFYVVSDYACCGMVAMQTYEHFKHLTRSSKVLSLVKRNCKKGLKGNAKMRCHAWYVGHGYAEFLFEFLLLFTLDA